MVVSPKAELIQIGSSENAAVDIIFVCPLLSNVSSEQNILQETSSSEERLPKLYPKARTFCFRYSGAQANSAGTVNGAATDLFYEWNKLESEWSTSSTTAPQRSNRMSGMLHSARPVIFVGHSLGGLVVKQALVLAEMQSEIPLLVQRTFGIIYIDTPHMRGTTNWMRYLGGETGSTYSCPSKWERNGLANELEPSELWSAFHRVTWPYMRVNICHGCQLSSTNTGVLHQDCLWSAFSQFRVSQYEDKHWIIPKDLSPELTNLNIEQCINYMIEGGLETISNPQAIAEHTFIAAVRECEHRRVWLARGKTIKEGYARARSENTGEWLFALESYRAWAKADGPPILWLHGSAGMGKSTLCSAIIDALQDRKQQEVVTVFCFLEDAPGNPDSAEYILRTLVYRLWETRGPTVPEHILRSVLRTVESHTDQVHSEILRRGLRDIFGALDSKTQTTLVIDGFDRDHWVRTTVMDEIIRANIRRKSSKVLKCAISTRSGLDKAFPKGSISEVHLDSQHLAQHHLRNFALMQLNQTPLKSHLDRHSNELVAELLCSRAHGSFLWVKLATETLFRQNTPLVIPRDIDFLPSTIYDFYHTQLDAIPPSDIGTAQSVFSWLTAATRFLLFSELVEALEVSSEPRHNSVCAVTPAPKRQEQQSQSEIMQICAWLIDITEEGYVKFKHQSVRQYLVRTNDRLPARQPILEAHEYLAHTCLVILNERERTEPSLFYIDSSSSKPEREEKFSTLSNYAVANWSFHYRLAESHSKVLAGTLRRCISTTLDYACEFFSISRNRRSVQIATTTLRICAHYGFVSLTQICLEMGMHPNGEACHYCETPLAIATAGGHAPVATLLLHKMAFATSQIYDRNQGVMQLAAAQGSLETMRSLMSKGGDPNEIDPYTGRRPLHNAAAYGHLSLVKLLIDAGVDVNVLVPETQETPLHLAALYGHLSVVKYLVDGRDASTKEIELYDRIVEQPCFQSWTNRLLGWDAGVEDLTFEAMKQATAEHVQELLLCSRRYADLNTKTWEGWAAVHLAASKGHDAIVGFLLEKGAALQLTGDTQCTAVQIAAESGHLATVRLLLAAGAKVYEETESIGSLLARIEQNGHHSITNLLLWHTFISKVAGSGRNWPLLSLATKSRHTTVRDAIRKKHVQRRPPPRIIPTRYPLQDRDNRTYFKGPKYLKQ